MQESKYLEYVSTNNLALSLMPAGTPVRTSLIALSKTVFAASAVVGAVLGLAYEFIANSLDRTVKNKKYIEETFNIKVIGMIPDISKSVGNGSDASDVNEL